MIIREALLKDIGLVEELGKRLNEYHLGLDEYYKLKPKIEPRKHYEKLIKSKNSALIVAEENQRIVGFAAGNIHRRTPIFEVEMRGWITDVFVLEEYRRSGVGSILMEAMFSWFDRNDVLFVELAVDARNMVGIDFWEALGFETWQFVMKKKTR